MISLKGSKPKPEQATNKTNQKKIKLEIKKCLKKNNLNSILSILCFKSCNLLLMFQKLDTQYGKKNPQIKCFYGVNCKKKRRIILLLLLLLFIKFLRSELNSLKILVQLSRYYCQSNSMKDTINLFALITNCFNILLPFVPILFSLTSSFKEMRVTHFAIDSPKCFAPFSPMLLK